MNTEHLYIFVHVYRANSFAIVAKELNLAPSSISRTIAKLEQELDSRLFQRSTRKLIATEAGKKLYTRIRPLLEEMDSIRDDILNSAKQLSGKIRISTSNSFGQLALMPIIEAFRKIHTGIKFDIVLSDKKVHLLDERIDIAIRHGELNDSNLIASKLTETSYHVVASPKYLKQSPKISKPADITHHQIINFPFENFRSTWFFYNKNKRQELKIQIEPSLIISNAAAIREASLNNLGLALLANWTIKEYLRDGKLIDIFPNWKISGKNKTNPIWLLYPSRSFTPARVKVFSDFLKFQF